MNPKITADHLARAAIVYVRQSTMAQVVGNLEGQRRQYDLAGAARATGFASGPRPHDSSPEHHIDGFIGHSRSDFRRVD
jgi:hypothetical protein